MGSIPLFATLYYTNQAGQRCEMLAASVEDAIGTAAAAEAQGLFQAEQIMLGSSVVIDSAALHVEIAQRR